MEIKVEKKFIRISPDKIRLVAGFIRNKNAEYSLGELKFLNKSASKPVIEVIKSGLSAAKNKDMNTDEAYIKRIIVNEGPKLKRRRIIHRGRATAIAKRTAHIILILADKNNNKENKRIAMKEKNYIKKNEIDKPDKPEVAKGEK